MTKYSMKVRDEHFDSDFTLVELLAGTQRDQLAVSLEAVLGASFRVVSSTGEVLLGAHDLPQQACRCELRFDFEILGFLEAPAILEAQSKACAKMVELLLRTSARYLMASHLHEENVSESYQRLQHDHEALLKSEFRYKQLAEELDARVQSQVETIKNAERQLYAAEKMASVGQLAAGVAHEINNPIGFIRSNLGTAKAYVQQFSNLAQLIKSSEDSLLVAAWIKEDLDFVLDDFASLLDESIAGADRVTRIVGDLKGFSDIDRVSGEVCNVNDCVTTVFNLAINSVPLGTHLATELDVTPPLRCQSGHLNQAILNLLMNAVQAVGNQGLIKMRTESNNSEILVHVIDNGVGIPCEVLPRIFEPFFTTRDVGQGKGLGLTVCRDIVQAYGGWIDVQSQVGEGSHFTMHLPLNQEQH